MNENQNSPFNSSLFFSLNYIFYGLYFILFAGLQIFHVLLIDPSTDPKRSIFVLYAGIESFIEILCFASISSWLLHRKWKWTHRFFLLFLGALLFCHVMDFLLVRLMDISVWHGMEFFFQESLSNIIEILLSTTVKPFVWILAFTISILLILSVWAIFHGMEKIYQKKPLLCSGKTLFGLFTASFSFLMFNDVLLLTLEESGNNYTKALPWKRTLWIPEENTIQLKNYLASPSIPFSLNASDSSLFSLERRPDIFLFIVESLREDFLTKQVTPIISTFKEHHSSFNQTLSISNATHTSWFSLFYSTYPFHWSKYRDKTWTEGSPTLALLKKMGYQIHVYSASRLNFYSMNTVLFGNNEQHADSLQQFQKDCSILPYQADKAAIETLCQDVLSSDKKGGRVFITFLDSTHFDYSWPDDQTIFTPIEEKVNYLKMSYARDNLETIQNRYKNSLHYIDHLFGSFQSALKTQGLWDESVVIFTADHGEEYNEYGCMFHASNLSPPQIEVPLYMKLSSSSPSWKLQESNKASQIDIFPTLFHYLIGEDVTSSIFQGKSLFSSYPTPYLVGARYNGILAPYQFYVQSGNYRMTAEFCNANDIFHCDRIKILSIEDEKGGQIPFSNSFLETNFQEALDELFRSTPQ